MAGLSNLIERFLKEMLEENDGRLEIGRNDLANRFDCAPSQINYVLSTRFTPYKGYYIESRRGGAGYIRIIKLTVDRQDTFDAIDHGIGKAITKDKAYHFIDALLEDGMIQPREALIIKHAMEDQTLASVDFDNRNTVRADLLRHMLLAVMRS